MESLVETEGIERRSCKLGRGRNDALIQDFTYDSTGNQLTAGTSRHYVWTAANRLLVYKNQVGSSDPTIFAQYDYDGAGNRVSKLVRTGNGSTTYTRTIYIDGIFEYHKLENSTTYEKNYVHVMDDQSRIAMVRVGDQFPDDISESITYNLENQIKSSSARLDTNGTVIDREEYYPFGETSFGSHAFKRYKYNGKERDGESGLYYYGARYYSAWCCRFISVDGMAFTYNQLTPYQNAGNNPIGDRDIDGNQSEKTPEGAGNNQNNNSNNQNKTGNNSKVLKNKNIHKAEVKTQFEGEYGRDYMEISNDVAGSANDDGYINTYTPGFVKKVFWNPDFKEGEQQGSYFVQRSKVPQRVSISRIEPKSYTYAIERPQIIKPQSTAPPSLSRPEKVPHLPLNENIVVPVPILTDGTLIVNSLDNSVVALDNLIETIKAMGNTINSITINSQIGEGRGRFEGQYNQNAFQNISTYISNQLPNLQIKRGWVGSARGENRISGLSKPISVRINSPN